MNLFLTILAGLVISTAAAFSTTSHLFDKLGRSVTPVKTGVQSNNNSSDVLGETTVEDSVTFNVDAIFNKALIVKGKITADNIVYGIRAGSGVGVGSSDPQNPIITNTGVLSVQGKTGELKLEQGSGITIDGLKITNSGIISLTSGTGITVSGSTITNSDLGSSQNIFKTISVSGQDDIVVGSNIDTLTFTAGSGITLTTDSTNDKLTISSNDPNIAAGWTHGTDSIYLTTSTDSVGIGTTDPSYKLHVVGTEYVSDTLTVGGALSVTGDTTLTGALSANGNVTLGNATTDSLTFVGRIANGTSLVPDTDLGSNLGSSDFRFNNLWVANINSNSSQAFSGQTTFSYPPTDTTIDEASVFINPATSVANGQLLGLGIAGYQKALIDEDGDIILGYSNLTSAPVTDYPLTIYGHSGTNVAYIDTSGNLNITGGYSISGNSVLNATTLGTGVLNSSLTSTGTLNSGSITSGFGAIDTGSDNIVTTGTVGSSGLTSFTGNSLAVNSITSTGDLLILPTGNVGIGTATPASKLSVVGDIAAATLSGVEGLKLTDTSDTTKLAMKWTGTGVALDIPSLSTVNQLTNGTFETDITTGGWGSYTLNDQFTTNLPAGSVNGTSAEPTGGTRTVVDTESKLSISSSQLNLTSNSTWGNPGIWYPAIARAEGKTVIGKLNFSDITADKRTIFGFSDTTSSSGTPSKVVGLNLPRNGTGEITVVSVNISVGTITTSTDYLIALVLRGTGAYYYIKGGSYTSWTLLWIGTTDSTATLYPYVANNTAIFTADNIRIPTSTWLPTPLAYDTFTRADGAIGSSETTGPDSQTTPSLAWAGGAISTNKNVITPSLGSELWESPASTFDSGTYAWAVYGTNTIANDSNSLKVTYVDSVGGAKVYLRNTNDLSSDLTVGVWYGLSVDAKKDNAAVAYLQITDANDYTSAPLGTDYTAINMSFRGVAATGTTLHQYLTAGNVWLDNLSLKPLTLSSLFSTVSTSDSDVIADVTISALTSGTQAGLVLNLDNTTTPANFIIVYHDGTNVKVDEAVAGVYTNKQSTAVTYVAGATLRAIREGTKLRVYYNNALVGAELTMTANTNTKHGLFSTYSGNSFDNFTLWPRGTGNEYVNLPAEDLTATRDTSIHYSGSSSLKLVAGSSDNGYTQSYTLPNTNNYTLSAFAYTDGSAVTASDLSLENGDVNLATTYTSVGNGWYKLSASFAGVTSARNYGVKVKAEKTVYIDNISLFASASGINVLGITNSTTGLGGLSVESTTTLNSGLASLQALIVKGFSGQTEDLQEWQDSTGTVLGSVSSTGGLTLAGNLDVNGTTNDIAGTLNLSGNSLTSSGALSITPNAGSNISFSLSGTGDMIVNTNDLVVDTSLGYVGIGTAAPTALLDLAGTSGMDAFRLTNSGSKVLGLSYGTNATTFDIVSTDPTNKASNGTFETDLTGWDIPYALNDEFTTDKTSAQLVGTQTSAEPTGGTRTVVDTGNDISVSSGKLSVTYGTYGSTNLYYPSTTRVAGKMLLGELARTAWRQSTIGFKSSQGSEPHTGIATRNGNTVVRVNNVDKDIQTYGGTADTLSTVTILRTSGAYYFIKLNTGTYNLMWIDSTETYSPLYPGLGNYTGDPNTFDNIRVPTALWLPTPLAYDDFASADMTSKATGPDVQTAPQLAWTGGSDAGGVMTITPSLGSGLIDGDTLNGNMETGSPPTGWTLQNGATLSSDADERTGGSGTKSLGTIRGTGHIVATQPFSTTTGIWYLLDFWGKSSAPGMAIQTNFATISDGSATWKNIRTTGRAPNVNGVANLYNYDTGGGKVNYDDISVKPLILSSLFSSVSTSDSDVIADANITEVEQGVQAGVALNLNSATTPTEGVVAYLTRTNATTGATVTLDKFTTATTWTNVQAATAVTYSAGATLRVIKDGTKYRVYYNNALVGSEQTISDATLIDNTIHGLFSTYSTNSFDNFTLWPRGSSTTKFTSAPFEELTATRDTTYKYNNSTASVQLVAGATDGVYSQSINVANTNTQNVVAFAYTNGSAVTSADLSLYYDTAAITTTYAPMGATGWYKLTGSVTGVASAKEYGVVVKTGKTVYVDDFKVQEGVGTTQNMYVMNSNTGVTGLNVQGLINGTLNGVATLSKAGTISDSDFAGGVADGMMAIDTTNHRIYFREGGSWSYSAKAGGFQIPKEEVLGLSTGDYLLPYVDTFMSDGAVHGMYQKFDLNKLLATQGAVTFVSDVTFLGKTVFNKDTAGTAIISTYSSQVDVKFDNTYDVSPIITMNLVIDATDSAFIEEGQKAYLTNVSPTGFTIMLPTLALKDFMYNWIAFPINAPTLTITPMP